MKKVSIVIANWNGKHIIKTCLESIYKQSLLNFEVIVSDNGSTDGSIKYIKKFFPKVRLIENKENLGFAEGNNVAIKKAKGKYILTLNNDARLQKNCLKELVKSMESNTKIGMVAPKMFLGETKNIDTLGLMMFQSLLPWDCKSESKIKEVICACSGAALYRRKALDDIKIDDEYFDPDFYLYSEDFDLGLRLRLRGWEYTYAPKAIVHHLHSATAKKIPDKIIFYTHRNVIWAIIKNVPSNIILRNIGLLLLGQIGSVLKYSLRGKPVVIINSKFSALIGLPKMLLKRRKVMSNKKISDSEFRKLLYNKNFRF